VRRIVRRAAVALSKYLNDKTHAPYRNTVSGRVRNQRGIAYPRAARYADCEVKIVGQLSAPRHYREAPT